jgi:chromate reductase
MADAPLALLTLVGSLRKGSYNAAVARALPELAPPGVTIVHGPSVGDLPLYDADLQEVQGIPPRAQEIGAAVAAADGVIIVTPEYNHSVPGVLKNALDWVSRMSPQPFTDKPVAIQSASPGAMGGIRAQLHMRHILVFLRAITLAAPEVIVFQGHKKISEDGVLHDQPTRDAIKMQLEAFAKFVRRVKG